MDSTPYHHHHRSSERRTNSRTSPLCRIGEITATEPLRISLDLDQSPTTATKPSSSPSPLSLLRSPTRCYPLRELLLMSPPSSRKSKPRFDDEMQESNSLRRRCRAALSSPRNSRRSRRRSEVEVREEKEIALMDEVGKQRKRRNSGRQKKDKLSLVPFQPPKAEEENVDDSDGIGNLITELIMWKDVQKSTFWFGFGSLCFLSSCFTKGINFSIFSAISQLGILFLAFSFISNSVRQRDPEADKQRSYAKLKEDDILHLAKLFLPALNFALSKTKELFSGEPSMTLKVAPFLLLGAQYGHLITIWRLSAIGFFVSFSVPQLYSCYASQINQRAECLKLRLLDAWIACSHKKIVVVSALITFWNLSSIKTRICTGFLLVVIFRYIQQNVLQKVEDGDAYAEDKHRQVLLVAEPVDEKRHQALLVAA
ncbi:unnamed protein product [Lathyrus oleraceus]|uniref:Reticulon-like protein n=1 Tax=Pisum sativum TaxID=3888 RepID=A0A9D4VQ35_PEA|nr:reticulon-like protein B17 [Pisum sativum]KAI5387807.1 hypothetical protein KIW84_073772 [Pisum sativum]